VFVLNALIVINLNWLGVSIAERLLLNINVQSVDLRDLINMAMVIITLKIMPDSPEVDLDALEQKVKTKIQAFCGETETKTEIKPIAFGLKSMEIIFVMDESKGSTEYLEKQISDLEGVSSVSVIDVRRAIG